MADLKNCSIAWNPPAQEWIKLNVDGSRNPVLGTIAAGGVIRDHRKKWLSGFALNKGTDSVNEAEVWGIFEGLKLVWKEGHKKVVVESDSQNVVLLLTKTSSINHPLLSIIQACKDMIACDWSCHILHAYRETNRVDDGLACLGHSLDLGITIFKGPPSQIIGVLEDDFKGTSFARRVPIL
ncbi:hypothetical protein Dsin_013491 [Dipteronia sinensis]|uniref:RNase H type-1 domain-containing protein n=1 Tax=Dipteronia sinensis TaxID=43782 RepID=A0AAE0AK20_9ROSI|nr:hypothetical protein Dsin_013491 [Dipteronia sinensis]